ncbi:MAG TPA: NAD(P)/FAD-dependent oxidoreductase [Hyphomicrobiaceae bacterium]|nr:NAD(P)/FAD-dependent oxidoreductase [Hyphomicrobiaceae bacterium]
MADDESNGHDGVAALMAQARRDIARVAHPAAPWLEPRIGPDGRPALDVLIIGAGQSGLAIAFALMRAQVRNILAIDKAAYGCEGPWLTYARMRTLRSPKDYTGPDLDIPSLTYQSWHEARFGAASWEALGLIPKELWAEYLLWVRETTAVPVRNGCEAVDIASAPGGLIAVTVARESGQREVLYARKLVLATGQEGMGRWWMPDFVSALPARHRAHAADAIDFAALEGKVVAVLGAGASALDNAAEALENGAAAVHLFCRRTSPQVVQPYRWLTFAGFLRHLSDLDDAWRWRFMSTILGLREGFPQDTWDRCARHGNFHLHSGAPWLGARCVDAGVELTTPQGPFRADFVICGTGVDMDFALRPELTRFAANIATWGDRYEPPAEERDERLARYPYLGRDYELIEKRPGATPWIGDVHVFAIASTMSFGPSGSSINAMTTAVRKLVDGLTRGLFRGDVERHWQSLRAYNVPQAVIGPAPSKPASSGGAAPA